MPTAAVDEAGPSDAPVDPTTMTAAGADPAGSEPAGSEPAGDDPAGSEPSSGEPSGNDGSRTVPPTDVDAAAACATTGGFTIAATSSCYMLGDNVFAWQDARSFCQAWGGDLVEIDSLEENVALAQAMDESAWIGATDQDEEGIFRWAGGAPLIKTKREFSAGRVARRSRMRAGLRISPTTSTVTKIAPSSDRLTSAGATCPARATSRGGPFASGHEPQRCAMRRRR
jgi:hypothetical protein